MGGNALKNTQTRRLQAAEYHQTIPKIEQEIASVLGSNHRVGGIESYSNKPDFGDADVLVESDKIRPDYKDEIARVFKSNEVYKNGNVTSFDRAGFQVDVIAIANENYDYAKAYFSFNDLGNLVGRVAHKMGLKHSFEGLKIPVRDGDHMFAELTLTRDMDRALSFMGYDPKRFNQGFQDMKEIFEYTASTPYFDPSVYLLENRNATSRIRDAKRKTYNAFLQWLDAPDGLKVTERAAQAWFEFPKEKSDWLPKIWEEFPEVAEEYAMVHENLARNRLAKKMFNGELVSEQTGLTGRPLGEFIQSIRKQHSSNEVFTSWVVDLGPKGIENFIDDAFEEHKKKRPKAAP